MFNYCITSSSFDVDIKVSIPTSENALHTALSKSRSAGSSAGCSKSVTVI